MQKVSTQIWIHITLSISFDDNRYTTYNSLLII